MEDHVYLEMLGAMAASGQLTSVELAELEEHAKHCSRCGNRLAETTELSAQLFCVHSLKAPGMRVPGSVVERFIARANSEGIPLRPRAKNSSLNQLALPGALFATLLLVSLTVRLDLLARWTDAARQGDVASISRSVDEEKVFAAKAPSVTPGSARASGIRCRHAASRNGREAVAPASPAGSAGTAHSDAEPKQFNVEAYARNVVAFYRPPFKMARPDQVVRWPSAANSAPQFQFAQPQNLAKNDPPALLAECERWTLHPWNTQEGATPMPVDAETLRHDFEPQASAALLSRDFRGNLPALQFARNIER